METENRYYKIASQIYTYIKNADDNEDQLLNKSQRQLFQQLKVMLLSHKQKDFCDLLINCIQHGYNKLIDKRDNKNYTLLMIAASNNLIDAVKCLLQNHADPYLPIQFKGRQFNSLFNFKLKKGLLTQEQIQECQQTKKINATALDIAYLKNNAAIVKILKSFFEI